MRIALIALLACAFAPAVLGQPPPPPLCSTINPVPSDFEIRYTGQVSGCTQDPGSRPCVKGEEITFDTTSKYDVYGCPLSHTWTFGDGSPPLHARPADHTYATAGLYAVSADIITPVNEVTVSRSVTVADSVPALSSIAATALALTILLIAFARMKAE